MEKLKFWTPFIAGFLVRPGQLNYTDADFYKNKYLPPSATLLLFLAWHASWMTLAIVSIAITF